METSPAVIDLFCGAGGLTLGAYRAGFRVAVGADHDKDALSIHRANFPSCKVANIDVGKTASGDLLRYARRKGVEGVIGGPPCQGFSVIGKRESKDPRNALFTQFFRHVAKIRPDFFVAENVPGILGESARPLVSRGLEIVASDYHVLPPIVINAADYGAPTERKRVFFIGFRQKVDEREFSNALNAAKSKESIRVRDALLGVASSDDPSESHGGRLWGEVRWNEQPEEFADSLRDRIPKTVGDAFAVDILRRRSLSSGFQRTVHTAAVRKRFGEVKQGQVDRVSRAIRLDPAAFCPVLRAGTGPEHGSFTALRPIHAWEPRVILPREAARLQGFPDWFLLHNTIWHSLRHIGNSVSPLVAEKVLRVVRSFI
jgi:DNA (cytosine-5)-methyltransferase 1